MNINDYKIENAKGYLERYSEILSDDILLISSAISQENESEYTTKQFCNIGTFLNNEITVIDRKLNLSKVLKKYDVSSAIVLDLQMIGHLSTFMEKLFNESTIKVVIAFCYLSKEESMVLELINPIIAPYVFYPTRIGLACLSKQLGCRLDISSIEEVSENLKMIALTRCE